MSLPYTIEVFFASMALYNDAVFPAPSIAALLAVVAVGLVLRPFPDRDRVTGGLIGTVLAIFWIWVGALHQLRHMAELNFMAPIYGYAWMIQGGLIAAASLSGRLRWSYTGDIRHRAGLGIALFGLFGYPLVVLLLGYDWRSLPIAGTAPAPTAILTAGLLLLARERPPCILFVIPFCWAGVTTFSAYKLDFILDFSVPAAVLASVWRVASTFRRRAGTSGPS